MQSDLVDSQNISRKGYYESSRDKEKIENNRKLNKTGCFKYGFLK